jgi:hypothetical protein
MVGMAFGGTVFYYQHHHFCLSAYVICLVTGSLLIVQVQEETIMKKAHCYLLV